MSSATYTPLPPAWHPEQHGEKPEAYSEWLSYYMNQPVDVAERATETLRKYVHAMTWRNPLRSAMEVLPMDLPEVDCQFLAAAERVRKYYELSSIDEE